MITGATGYVAGWIVKKLLDEGFTVHAPVRNPENKEKLKYLNETAEKASGKIKYFKADLLETASYDEAIKNCELVFHTASPFINKVKYPQKDLLDPALKGTINVLESANITESVKRVVLTSSCAAIIGDAIDCENYPNGLATEEFWNDSSSLNHQPYSYSKVLAEKKAWKIAEAQNRWDLVVINPSLVIGPGINPKSTSESFNLIKQLGNGKMRFGLPDYTIGVVDVRDLAAAHYNAGFTPEAKGRHIISGENTDFLNMSVALHKKYADKYPLPKKTLPKFLVWLVAPAIGVTRKAISKNVGHKWKVDNTKSIKQLNMKYRTMKESIMDFFQQMIDNDVFKN